MGNNIYSEHQTIFLISVTPYNLVQLSFHSGIRNLVCRPWKGAHLTLLLLCLIKIKPRRLSIPSMVVQPHTPNHLELLMKPDQMLATVESSSLFFTSMHPYSRVETTDDVEVYA